MDADSGSVFGRVWCRVAGHGGEPWEEKSLRGNFTPVNHTHPLSHSHTLTLSHWDSASTAGLAQSIATVVMNDIYQDSIDKEKNAQWNNYNDHDITRQRNGAR